MPSARPGSPRRSLSPWPEFWRGWIANDDLAIAVLQARMQLDQPEIPAVFLMARLHRNLLQLDLLATAACVAGVLHGMQVAEL
jgi:hypothetical protein